jgi:hypothetical protein
MPENRPFDRHLALNRERSHPRCPFLPSFKPGRRGPEAGTIGRVLWPWLARLAGVRLEPWLPISGCPPHRTWGMEASVPGRGHLARVAFMSGMDLALLAGAIVGVVGGLVALAILPARPARDGGGASGQAADDPGPEPGTQVGNGLDGCTRPEKRWRGIAMKWWMLAGTAVAAGVGVALLAGKDDIIRMRRMRQM